jgi:hypothetical protein
MGSARCYPVRSARQRADSLAFHGACRLVDGLRRAGGPSAAKKRQTKRSSSPVAGNNNNAWNVNNNNAVRCVR